MGGHVGRDLAHCGFMRGHVGWGSVPLGECVWFFGKVGNYLAQYSSKVVPSTIKTISGTSFMQKVVGVGSTILFGEKGYGPLDFSACTPYNGYGTFAAVPFTMFRAPIWTGTMYITWMNYSSETTGWYSSPDGITWTIISLNLGLGETSCYYKSCQMIRTSSGRLATIVKASFDSGVTVTIYSVLMYSDNNGSTWSYSIIGQIDSWAHGSIVFITIPLGSIWENGGVLYVCDTKLTTPYTPYRFSSADNGATWSALANSSAFPYDAHYALPSGRIIGLPAHGRLDGYYGYYSDDNLVTRTNITAAHYYHILVAQGSNRLYDLSYGSSAIYYSDDGVTWVKLVDVTPYNILTYPNDYYTNVSSQGRFW
jgi:hypothetical protein